MTTRVYLSFNGKKPSTSLSCQDKLVEGRAQAGLNSHAVRSRSVITANSWSIPEQLRTIKNYLNL